MAASQEQKVDFLLKKIGYVQSKTGIAEDSSISGTKKAPTEESKPSPLVVPSTSIWADSTLVPSTPPTSNTSYVGIYTAANAFQLTHDNTVAGNRTFIARSTFGNQSSSISGDWIDPSFGADYAVQVYKGDPDSGGVSLSPTGSGSSDEWFFDYSSGILNFNGTNVPSGITTTNVYLIGYKYTGAKGAKPAAGIATFSTLSVSGISTFTGNIDANGDLDVDGTTELDVLNVAETATFSSNIDANGNLDVDGTTELDTTNISETLNVVGIATFASDVDLNAGLDVDGHTELDDVNVSTALTANNLVVTGSTLLKHSDSLKLQTIGIGVSISNGIGLTATIAGPSNLIIDPGVVGDNTGTVRIKGDLFVDGTQTQINSTTIELADFIVGIATTATSDSLADGAGIQIGPNNTFLYEHNSGTNPSLKSSENLNVASGKVYQVDQTEVLSATTLGSGVVNSSLTNLGTLTALTVSGAIDANGDLDVDGHTELDNLNVSGVSTFASNVDINADLDVDGKTELDITNISETLNVTGIATFANNIDANGDLDVDGHTELDNVNVSAASTFGGLVDINAGAQVNTLKVEDLTDNRVVIAGTGGELEDSGNLTFNGTLLTLEGNQTVSGTIDVDGQAIFDDITVSAASTFGGLVDINAGGQANTFKVEDLTDNRVVIVGTGGELEDSGNLTFNGSLLNVTGQIDATAIVVGSATTITSSGIVAGIVTGTLDNDLTLATSGTGLSGSATYNNSGAQTFTVTSNATDANTASTLVARDGSGDFSAGTITATLSGNVTGNLTGTATTATNLANGANITTGTISDDRLPDLITSNVNIASGISSVATLDATNATIDNLTFTSGTAITSIDTDLSSVSSSDDTLASAKAIKTYIDTEVTAQDLDFQADTGGALSIDLDSETLSVVGTSNEIETAGSGNQIQIGLPNEVEITTSLVVGSATTINAAGIIAGIVTATLDGNAGTATSLANSRNFSITGDVVASPISFDGTGNVSFAATIQPNSVALATDTTGDYVESISGTSNQITVTSGTGEGSTPVISIPNNPTLPGTTVTIANDLQVNRNLNVTGNVTIGGTSATIFADSLRISDPDLILGIRTDANGNDIATDSTASHGGIAIASTEGTPLVSLVGAGETLPFTYKKIMWFEQGAFSGLGTDAWLINYGVGIGSTQVPNKVVLAAGDVHVTNNDIIKVRNINATGIITATTFSGGLATSDLTGTITNAQLAGSIENGKLSNSTITVSDGSNSTATALGGTITFSGTSSEVEVAESSGTITVGLPNDVSITGDLTVGTKTVIGTETASLTTTSQTSIHAGLSASTYRSVEYTIQATEGTNFHATKILALHNGTTAYHSEYGTIYNSSSVATFDVDVNGGNLRLLATGASANTTNYTINFVATKI